MPPRSRAEQDRLHKLRDELGLAPWPEHPHLIALSDVYGVLDAPRNIPGYPSVADQLARSIDTWRVKEDGSLPRGTYFLLEDVANMRGTRDMIPKQLRDAWNRVQVPQISQARIQHVHAYLGPTNSGKTWHGLKHLIDSKRGVFAAPLRMLAQEAYGRLCDELGEANVGLVTGEERINEHAPVICCTAEMAKPREGTLIVDEIHWADDADRGSAWTQLLLNARCDELILLGSPDADPLVQAAFPHAQITHLKRLVPLHWTGPVRIDHVRSRTVIVAFSRKAVLALAQQVQRYGKRAGALYGAMPPAARRHQIQRFINGELDVIVSTDVIGHGINLPCDTVLFAETEKFDGYERRALDPWEVAQIAGRAGRYGLSEAGMTGTLEGVPWLRASTHVVKRGLEPPRRLDDGTPVHRIVRQARFGPMLQQLGCSKATQLTQALSVWQVKAYSQLHGHPWLHVENVDRVIHQLGMIGNKQIKQLTVAQAWRLAHAPVDEDDADLMIALAGAVINPDSARLMPLLHAGEIHRLSLEQAEAASRIATTLRWFALAFPGCSDASLATCAQAELDASERISELLDAQVADTAPLNACECGRERAPWHAKCSMCHQLGIGLSPAW